LTFLWIDNFQVEAQNSGIDFISLLSIKLYFFNHGPIWHRIDFTAFPPIASTYAQKAFFTSLKYFLCIIIYYSFCGVSCIWYLPKSEQNKVKLIKYFFFQICVDIVYCIKSNRSLIFHPTCCSMSLCYTHNMPIQMYVGIDLNINKYSLFI